jgi:hypothetical protein
LIVLERLVEEVDGHREDLEHRAAEAYAVHMRHHLHEWTGGS